MSNRNDDRSRRIQASMANDPFFDDASDVLDEHELLDEGEFIDDDDGGFDDEATAVFRADLHGSHPDPWSSEGSLGHDAGDYTDEATSVLMEPEPEPAPAPYVPPQGNQPRPARPSGAHGRVPSYSAPRAAAPQAHAPRAQAAPARAAHGYPSGGQGAVHHGTPGVAEVAARRDDEMAEEATVVTDIHTFQQQQQQQAAGYPPNASGNWAAGAAAGGAAWQQAQAGAQGAPSGGWQAQQQVRPNTGQAPAMIAVPAPSPRSGARAGCRSRSSPSWCWPSLVSPASASAFCSWTAPRTSSRARSHS